MVLTGGGEPAEAGDVHSAGLVNDVFAGEIHAREDRVDLRRYLRMSAIAQRDAKT